MRDFAERLIAYETKGNKSSETKTAAFLLVGEKMRLHLTAFMGNVGFRARLSRALALANAEVPWLHAVHVKADGSFGGLDELGAQVEPEKIAEGGVVLFAQLLGLLVTFIGGSLTLRLASRSLSGTRTLTEAREVLTRRIQALARSQSALLAGGFEGASIAEIIRLEFEGSSDQIKSDGPDVLLNPRVAQTFALVVHELATNATKYGALSLPDGQVAMHWSIEGIGAESRFKFQWQERNGPPVIPPTRQGFGHMVIEKAAAQDFGLPKIKFASEGLSYEIDAPLSAVTKRRAVP
jgi:two-component sensor histidine kinase